MITRIVFLSPAQPQPCSNSLVHRSLETRISKCEPSSETWFFHKHSITWAFDVLKVALNSSKPVFTKQISIPPGSCHNKVRKTSCGMVGETCVDDYVIGFDLLMVTLAVLSVLDLGAQALPTGGTMQAHPTGGMMQAHCHQYVFVHYYSDNQTNSL